MKKFALVGGGKVVNVVVAEDASQIGPAALALTAIDITDMVSAPSVGSSYDRLTKKFSVAVSDNLKDLLTGDELVFTPETPAAAPAKSSSKKKSSTEETSEEE